MPKKLESNVGVSGREQFQVIKRTEKAPDTYQVGSKKIKLGSSGVILNDRGAAEELYNRHSRQVGDGDLVVVPVEKKADPGHKRSFLVRLPKNYKRG